MNQPQENDHEQGPTKQQGTPKTVNVDTQGKETGEAGQEARAGCRATDPAALSQPMTTFKSSAAADIMMFDDVATHMIVLMGKEATDKGVITVEQLPAAIAKLEAAINGDHEQHRAHLLADETQESDGHGNERPFVSLTRRVLPLLEMLRVSLHENEPVLWGV